MFERALTMFPGGVNSPVRAFRAVGGEPFFAARAKGSRIEDVDGNSYIDYVGTWGPAILGHAAEPILQAIRDAAADGTSFGVPNPRELELGQAVLDRVPSVKKLRFCNSGTEATLSCVRLARGFTKRDRIVKFEGCYHGHVDSLLVKAGSGALTLGQPDSAGIPAELSKLTTVLPFNDPEAVKALFADRGREIAAIIVEPVPANAGLYLPRPGYLELLRKVTADSGALLIFDEVMTGFRLGPAGAQGIYGIAPDLSAFGKIIGGGLPVGAFGGRADVMDFLAPLGPVYQAGTLSGNPLAMAGGAAALACLNAEAYRQLQERTASLAAGLREIAARRNIPLQVPQIGSMFCCYFAMDAPINLDGAQKSDTKAFARFFHGLLERGVYVAPSQFEAGFVSLAHGESEIEATLRAASEAFQSWSCSSSFSGSSGG
ncbi:MAG: glutamate-1-semialdehyde 2,1-aminomutase [Verrucomicrobiae bacterium]|nr:glutamate-1-semialdehyde 2,1-aminomutase [Verrucomicrobiae bacterium]